MSDPNRYHLWAALECHAFSKAEAVLRFSAEEDGMWVQWQDYARLKAEVERYKFTLEEERQIARQDWAGLRCEHDRVKRALEQAEAEVERLRKAGDELERVLISRSGSYEAGNASHEWQSAKNYKPTLEGKQP